MRSNIAEHTLQYPLGVAISYSEFNRLFGTYLKLKPHNSVTTSVFIGFINTLANCDDSGSIPKESNFELGSYDESNSWVRHPNQSKFLEDIGL